MVAAGLGSGTITPLQAHTEQQFEKLPMKLCVTDVRCQRRDQLSPPQQQQRRMNRHQPVNSAKTVKLWVTVCSVFEKKSQWAVLSVFSERW